jgi:alkylhydroperoxidase/carboxymuconolactone decarboxylase family protein YurZ
LGRRNGYSKAERVTISASISSASSSLPSQRLALDKALRELIGVVVDTATQVEENFYSLCLDMFNLC